MSRQGEFVYERWQRVVVVDQDAPALECAGCMEPFEMGDDEGAVVYVGQDGEILTFCGRCGLALLPVQGAV